MAIDVVNMDFSKVFVKISHERVLCKLYHMGFRKNQLTEHRLWLDAKKWKLVVESCFSEWRPVICVVLQGSVLGPFFYVFDVNNLDVNVQGMGS